MIVIHKADLLLYTSEEDQPTTRRQQFKDMVGWFSCVESEAVVVGGGVGGGRGLMEPPPDVSR